MLVEEVVGECSEGEGKSTNVRQTPYFDRKRLSNPNTKNNDLPTPSRLATSFLPRRQEGKEWLFKARRAQNAQQNYWAYERIWGQRAEQAPQEGGEEGHLVT